MSNPRPSSRGIETRARWLPEGSAHVILVTESDYLRDEVERIAAAAAVDVTLAGSIAEAGLHWERAPVVLAGSDIRELPPGRRAPAVLVGLSGEGDSLWHQAAALGAERVAVLPDAAGWLAEYLSHSSDPVSAGHVLGVIGGCGGAGASTAAILLAAQAARDGFQTLLIDGDAWGGGLELLLAAEEAPGLRWPDLAAASGSINPGQLEDSLPGIAGFSLLSWAAGPAMGGLPDMTGATQAVLEAARSGYRLTIIDVGRSLESISSFAWSCDEILVTVPAQLRATVATTQLIHELPGAGTSLLIRGQLRNGLDAQMIAESIGYPLAAHVPELKNAVAAAERGRVLELGSNRKVRRFTHHVLERLAERTVP